MESADRKIPASMASQHPDHAGKPYWHSTEFISTRQEVKECFLTFSDLGISEYKWDWEGKFVDESVIEKLLGAYYEYFLQHPIGKDKFITFRLPNPKVETEFRLGRAFMGILAAAGLAKQVGLHSVPLFEVILPMTESATEMLAIQEAFSEIASLKHHLYNFTDDTIKHIEVIPLFESVETMIRSDTIIDEYVSRHEKIFGFKPAYMRPYVARSDPALNSGLVPTILAIKTALSRYAALEKRMKIPLYPIIGSASLPFRGGLTPYTVSDFVSEYEGVRTALIQSAFRYDYPFGDVVKGISELEHTLPLTRAQQVTPGDEKKILELIALFEKPYRTGVESLAPVINDIASLLPKRRERVQHTGLFGYSRGVGEVRLPRAIGFTGAMYSLGIPPELVGTGRGLHEAQKKGLLPVVEKYYKGIRRDLLRAGRFLNKKAIAHMSKSNPVYTDILDDVRYTEQYLGESLKPVTDAEREHGGAVEDIAKRISRNNLTSELLAHAAILRKSLG